MHGHLKVKYVHIFLQQLYSPHMIVVTNSDNIPKRHCIPSLCLFFFRDGPEV